ncbi:hypothetical protein V8E55_008822 [Tylopilus felleus]
MSWRVRPWTDLEGFGINGAYSQELKRALPSCSSWPTTLSPVSGIAPFSAALAVQIFGLTQRATIVTLSVKFKLIVVIFISGHGQEGDAAVLSDGDTFRGNNSSSTGSRCGVEHGSEKLLVDVARTRSGSKTGPI